MPPQGPQVARDAYRLLRRLRCLVGISQPDSGAQSADKRAYLVIAEASECEIDIGHVVEFGEEPCQKFVVPGAGYLVECQVEQSGLFLGQVHENHRDCFQPKPSRCHEALMSSDDCIVLSPGDDRVDQAKLPYAPCERFKLIVADAPGVGWIGPKVVDWYLVDLQRLR